jgi:ribonuclease VapC
VILDTSAILAIVLKEPGFEALIDKLLSSDAVAVGAPTLAEAAIVLGARLGGEAGALLAHFLDELRVTTLPFEEAHWREALEAYLRFGKGRHPAALNFGDCLTYAVAKLSGAALLFVGEDFRLTDLEAA